MPYAKAEQSLVHSNSWPVDVDDSSVRQRTLLSSGYCRTAAVKQVQLSFVPHAVDFDATHQCLYLRSGKFQGLSITRKDDDVKCYNLKDSLQQPTILKRAENREHPLQHLACGKPASAAFWKEVVSLLAHQTYSNHGDWKGKEDWTK
jgi:hypothetical protein